MRYSERLLKKLDEEIARRRRNIERLASSIDAIGEFLSVAHCAGVDLRIVPPQTAKAEGLEQPRLRKVAA
ncbi:hypothetical protein RPSD_15510 [Ralstonia solanacearum]|nr:hypothetical protein RPSD_15510 [Ralstonia solanacearum]